MQAATAGTNVVEVEELARSFGDVQAVRGISFAVREGEIFGFLGPNGAGKSTTMKILCTLLSPSSGRAAVAGCDVVRDPMGVRRALGVVFQDPAVDDLLTARENLAVHCMVYRVSRAERRERVEGALAFAGLVEQGDRLVKTFSGGMRRRLEIARALLHRPRILFMDEPTSGLDPQTRRRIWKELAELRERDRVTVFMTTHYIEEAEACDRIAIIDRGKLIAEGSPGELRRGAGNASLSLSTADDARAMVELEARFGTAPRRTEAGLEVALPDGDFMTRLAGFPVSISRLSVHEPTLEDAFIALTGSAIRSEGAASAHEREQKQRFRGGPR